MNEKIYTLNRLIRYVVYDEIWDRVNDSGKVADQAYSLQTEILQQQLIGNVAENEVSLQVKEHNQLIS